MEILFPHDKFAHLKILPSIPLPQTNPLPQREKVPLKTSVHNNHYYM